MFVNLYYEISNIMQSKIVMPKVRVLVFIILMTSHSSHLLDEFWMLTQSQKDPIFYFKLSTQIQLKKYVDPNKFTHLI